MTEEELREVMDVHGDYLLKVAFYYCKNWGYAEEIVQDVFVKFYKKNEQFKEQASLRTYLTKMTINQSKDYLKSWRYKKILLFGETVDQAMPDQITKVFHEKLRQNDVLSAVFQLKPSYREVLIYYYFEEKSISEIALLLNENERTIRTRLQRARKKLRVHKELIELEGM
jgi:RNA polymerase sigma factor (sigma-70 family)